MSISDIRTTITLPAQVHQQLREEALKKHISLNDLLLHRIGVKADGTEQSVEEKIAKAQELFQRIGKKLGSFDPVQIIREERDQGHE